MENEQKEMMCLETYGVRYFKLTTNEKRIMDRLYSRRILEENQKEVN
jgi:hypothetical protein